MKVRVRYFASIREALGRGETVDVAEGASVGAVRDLLVARGGPHAEVLARGRSLRCARNQVLGDEGEAVEEDDELAFFPPVTGDDLADARVSIQQADFDLTEEVARLRAGQGGVGAVAVFVGTVRDRGDGRSVEAMELEHYPGMTERSIESMIDAAVLRFGLLGARVVHRVGELPAQAQIVMVAVTAPHRGSAFQGCEFLMDYLKTHAPFWKKESTPEGSRWVDARASDDAALARWGLAPPVGADPSR